MKRLKTYVAMIGVIFLSGCSSLEVIADLMADEQIQNALSASIQQYQANKR